MPGIKTQMSQSPRISVAHSGGRHCLISGAIPTYKATSRTGDYHIETYGKTFTRWVEERLIPNLDQSSGIVMDNAFYHSLRTDNTQPQTPEGIFWASKREKLILFNCKQEKRRSACVSA